MVPLSKLLRYFLIQYGPNGFYILFFFSAGTALVEDIASLASNSNSPTTPTAAAKNNRMPGNIVCGICGAVRYYAFILQAKKFGTFSCEPCRKFISKAIKMCENDQDSDEDSDDEDDIFPCLSATGMNLVFCFQNC